MNSKGMDRNRRIREGLKTVEILNRGYMAGMLIATLLSIPYSVRHLREVEALQQRIGALETVMESCSSAYIPEVRASDAKLYQQIEQWHKDNDISIPHT
ncbi:MAG: hypothetical protein ABIA93_02865 [Candidatus Woesearchaeota archaeon]